MADETTTPPPVPVGWVRLTIAGGGEAVVPITGLAVCHHDGAASDGTPGAHSTVSGPSCYHDVVETVAEVAALIDAAQRAHRRFDALPVMAAIVMQAQVGCSREDWTKANARAAVSTALEMMHHVDPLQAGDWLDAIDEREAGR